MSVRCCISRVWRRLPPAGKGSVSNPIELSDAPEFGSRLVGLSPTLQIEDAGFPPEAGKVIPRTGLVHPRVLRSRFLLTASDQSDSHVGAASFHVDRSIASALRFGDTLNMVRTSSGGLGISVIRERQLVVAVGSVTALPLGENVEAQIPSDLVEEAEALFWQRDPTFEMNELPVELCIDGSRHLFYGGTRRINGYEVWTVHGHLRGMPGTDECLAISRIGACSPNGANTSAMLLVSGGLELFPW